MQTPAWRVPAGPIWNNLSIKRRNKKKKKKKDYNDYNTILKIHESIMILKKEENRKGIKKRKKLFFIEECQLMNVEEFPLS